MFPDRSLLKRRLMFVFGASVFLVTFALLWSDQKPKGRQWQKLAELTNSSGQYFVVGQECQLLDGEGWRVFFSFVDSDKKPFGSLLVLETFPPWRNVRLTQTNETVQIWRNTQLVATFDPSKRVFRNLLNGASDEYVEGLHGQGTITTNAEPLRKK